MKVANHRRLWIPVILLLLMAAGPSLRADTWALPSIATNRSENELFEIVVTPASLGTATASRSGPTGILYKQEGKTRRKLWEAQLVNGVAPVSAKVSNSGRYVITLDEWHWVGKKPVVIYGKDGNLIAELTLANLGLERHPGISRSVSSYWWNENAIMVFGPPPDTPGEPWQQTLEDSLFIRLYWGEVLAIDLATGKVRDKSWWKGYPTGQADSLKKATGSHLDATWRRLAGEYFRKANFEPDPRHEGVTGVLLAGQLRLQEALPLLREVAAGRFKHWGAPAWKSAQNLQELARIAIAEIERDKSEP